MLSFEWKRGGTRLLSVGKPLPSSIQNSKLNIQNSESRSARHEDAAVDVVRLARDHPRLVAGQVDGERGDVLRLEPAADRRHRLLDVFERHAAAPGVVGDAL